MRRHWTPHAREDRFRLAEALGDPDSEAALLRGTIIATEQLKAHPRIGPAIDGTRIRKWPITETPCLFLYMVRDDTILLLRIGHNRSDRSEEHTSELQSLMRTSYTVFCLKQIRITHYTEPATTTQHR